MGGFSWWSDFHCPPPQLCAWAERVSTATVPRGAATAGAEFSLYAAHGSHSPAISLGTPGRLLGGFSQRQARHTDTHCHPLRFEPALSKETRIATCQRSPCMGWSQTWQGTLPPVTDLPQPQRQGRISANRFANARG